MQALRGCPLRVQLDVATLHPRALLKLSPSCPECICNRDVDVLVRLIEPRIATYLDRVLWNRELDAHMERLALALAAMRNFDHDRAALQARERVLEAVDPPLDGSLDGRTWTHSTKRDVDRNWHVSL